MLVIFSNFLLDTSTEDHYTTPSPPHPKHHNSNYLDIAHEASEAFGLGETPVLFARYPHPKSKEPELLRPTHLLNAPRLTRTRASSIEVERREDAEHTASSSNEQLLPGGGFKASEGSKDKQQTVPCVFKWTANAAAALHKTTSTMESFLLQKV